MTKRGKTPKQHADRITSTVEISPTIRRTYSTDLCEHALWINGVIVATVHRMGIAWSLVKGNPENVQPGARKFVGTFLDEAKAVAALDALVA